MSKFKQFYNLLCEEKTSGPLYHVTRTSNVDKILKTGLKTFQTTNWVKAGTGERYGEGQIFAFDNVLDAVGWAAKMDWEFNKDIGSGKISIVSFKDDGEWEVDESDPLGQSMAKGKWLKKYGTVAPENILKTVAVGLPQTKMLVSSRNENKEVSPADIGL